MCVCPIRAGGDAPSWQGLYIIDVSIHIEEVIMVVLLMK